MSTFHKQLRIDRIPLILIGLLWGLPQWGWAQLNLQGAVYNGIDQKPLPFVNVFLANTTLGTISDEEGKFLLKNVPKGRLDLIVSCVGFETLKLTIQTTERKLYRILLKPSEENLLNVTVKAKRNNKWKQNLAFFETNFLGSSDNASFCKLTNPQVLAFYDTLGFFKARASDLLIIENKALGYKLKYALVNFTYNYENNVISFRGYPVFEFLTPNDQKEAERWQQNQEKAYRGSIMHFMRSLYACRLIENGFIVQQIIEKIDKSALPRLRTVHGQIVRFYPTEADTIVRMIQNDTLDCRHLTDRTEPKKAQAVLNFKGLMQVTYYRENEPYAYQRSYYPSEDKQYVKAPQVSIIHLTQPSVLVEPDGHFYEPEGMIYEGYWSWELVAEMLPLDYKLPK